MSRFSNIHVLVLAFAIAMSPSFCFPSTKGEVFPVFTKWHVYVVNGLGNQESLFVHCKSKDDDLGIQNLSPGTNTTWGFRTNFFHSTLFWCYLRKSSAQHAALKVFWQDIYLFEKCNWKNCIWIAKDDGIYIKDFANVRDEFSKKWEEGWIETRDSYRSL